MQFRLFFRRNKCCEHYANSLSAKEFWSKTLDMAEEAKATDKNNNYCTL